MPLEESEKYVWQLRLMRGGTKPRETEHVSKQEAMEAAAKWFVMAPEDVPWEEISQTQVGATVLDTRAEIKRFPKQATNTPAQRKTRQP